MRTGTLGYSYKKSAAVALLIRERLGYTLQNHHPRRPAFGGAGAFMGTCLRLTRKSSMGDRLSTGSLIVLNAVPTFVIGLVLMLVFCFQSRLLPYAGLSSSGIVKGSPGYTLDRLRASGAAHPDADAGRASGIGICSCGTWPRRRPTKSTFSTRSSAAFPGRTIRWSYLLRNIAQPLNMLGMSVSVCVGGSVVIERIFSIGGMGPAV